MKKLALALALLFIGAQMLAPPPASAQASAPGQCEWPVTGNLIIDGDFSDPSGAAWELADPGPGLTHQVVVTDHPCIYGFATDNYWATQSITVSSQASILASFWSRNNQPLVSGGDFSHNYFSRRYDDYNSATTQFGFEQDLGVWTFHSICAPGHESIVEGSQRVSWFNNIGNGARDITGISIVAVDSCAAVPTATPTAVPTATPTSTPIPTATYTPEPTFAPTVITSLDPRGSARGSLPIGDPNQGGPLPGPAYIPAPDPLVAEITRKLWDYENLRGMFQMVQTLWVLAQQNFFISAFLTLGVLTMAVVWLVNTVKSAGNNL